MNKWDIPLMILGSSILVIIAQIDTRTELFTNDLYFIVGTILLSISPFLLFKFVLIDFYKDAQEANLGESYGLVHIWFVGIFIALSILVLSIPILSSDKFITDFESGRIYVSLFFIFPIYMIIMGYLQFMMYYNQRKYLEIAQSIKEPSNLKYGKEFDTSFNLKLKFEIYEKGISFQYIRGRYSSEKFIYLDRIEYFWVEKVLETDTELVECAIKVKGIKPSRNYYFPIEAFDILKNELGEKLVDHRE